MLTSINATGEQGSSGPASEWSNLLDRLAGEDMSFVFERLAYAGVADESEAAELETEFKKYMFLVAISDKALAMIGPKPDEVWHQFILFTREYDAFCKRTLGYFVDHLPDTERTPVPVEAGENFLTAYEAWFGDLPPIWFDAMCPNTRAYYGQRPLQQKPPVRWSGWAGRRA